METYENACRRGYSGLIGSPCCLSPPLSISSAVAQTPNPLRLKFGNLVSSPLSTIVPCSSACLPAARGARGDLRHLPPGGTAVQLGSGRAGAFLRPLRGRSSPTPERLWPLALLRLQVGYGVRLLGAVITPHTGRRRPSEGLGDLLCTRCWPDKAEVVVERGGTRELY